MNTEQSSVTLSPAWVAALAGGLIVGHPFCANPSTKATSSQKLIDLFAADFHLPLHDVDSLRSKKEKTYTMPTSIMQGWTAIMLDICGGMTVKGHSNEAYSMLALAVPLGDASDYWSHPEMNGIGRPPHIDDYVQTTKDNLIGEGEIPPLSPEPKDDIVENPDKYFDFGGLGERFGLN
jgi:hypothetical protein